MNRFKFNVTRTGDLSDTSKASDSFWIGKNTANANDFMNDILPSGNSLPSGRTHVQSQYVVKSDQIQELDEKFRLPFLMLLGQVSMPRSAKA